MKQFLTIFRYELLNYLKNKLFIGVALFLVAALAVVMFFPNISKLFKSEAGGEDPADRPVMLIYAEDPELASLAMGCFVPAFSDHQVKLAEGSLDALKAQISSGDAECAFAITAPNAYTYYVDNLSLNDSTVGLADTLMQELYRSSAMLQHGLSQQQVDQIMTAQVEGQIESLGKDHTKTYWYTYIMIIALFTLIQTFGQQIATSVASEKSSRAMELLVTSAKPASMMFGKVLAGCLAGLFQLTALFGSALLFYKLNSSAWGDNRIIEAFFDIPMNLLVYMLVYFVLGFLIYAFMYAALASAVSKMEDISTLIAPMPLILTAAYMVVLFSVISGDVDSTLMQVCSYIPFTSPMAMFARICMSTVPWYEIALSMGILFCSVTGIGFLAAKIYRVGVLLYGTPPKIGAILKAIRNA